MKLQNKGGCPYFRNFGGLAAAGSDFTSPHVFCKVEKSGGGGGNLGCVPIFCTFKHIFGQIAEENTKKTEGVIQIRGGGSETVEGCVVLNFSFFRTALKIWGVVTFY